MVTLPSIGLRVDGGMAFAHRSKGARLVTGCTPFALARCAAATLLSATLSAPGRPKAEAALEWVKRCADPVPSGEYEIEIRQVFEASDFETMTPELREQEERLRATVESRRGSS